MGSRIRTGVPLTAQAREIIFNVHSYFESESLKFKRSHSGHFYPVQKRVVQAIGISKTTLNRLLSDKFQVSPGCETKQVRLKVDKRSRKKSHAQLCEIVYNVYLYLAKECDEYNTVEDGYFNNAEDRVVKATGICRSYLSNILNEKENRTVSESKSETPNMSKSPKQVFDGRTLEMVPVVISSSESDSENDSEQEMSAADFFSVSDYDYVLT